MKQSREELGGGVSPLTEERRRPGEERSVINIGETSTSRQTKPTKGGKEDDQRAEEEAKHETGEGQGREVVR